MKTKLIRLDDETYERIKANARTFNISAQREIENMIRIILPLRTNLANRYAENAKEISEQCAKLMEGKKR